MTSARNISMRVLAAGLAAGFSLAGAKVTAEPARPRCPAPDPTARLAAEATFSMMRALGPALGKDVLSPSLYRLAPSGHGIELSAALGDAVPGNARAQLAIAQLDDSVADFLRAGQAFCERASQGFYFRMSPEALSVTQAAGQPWCGASLKSVSVTTAVDDANPFLSRQTPALGTFPASGTSRECSPFLGPAQDNPYLLVTLSRTVTGKGAVHTLAMDPVPYAEPGESYNTYGQPCGTAANPFNAQYALFAVPEHQNQWAERVWGSQCHMGRFSTAVSLFGTTVYRWTVDDSYPCVNPDPSQLTCATP